MNLGPYVARLIKCSYFKYYNVLEWEICLLWGSTLPKIRITSKKASNKSCLELNFIQKSLGVHMSISTTSRAGSSKDQYVWNLITYRNGNYSCIYVSFMKSYFQFFFNEDILNIILSNLDFFFFIFITEIYRFH